MHFLRALNNGVQTQFHWKKEIILVTGGSGGIGAAAVQRLATRGSKIVVIDVIPLTFPKRDNITYYKCDLTDFEALKATAAIIESEIGRPTCVVANAGICRGKSLFDATQRDIELTFGVNNLGLIWTAKTFIPAMVKENRGHFLIIASQTGLLATANIADYAATKSAALAIYEGLHTEIKHLHQAPNVRISCISPSAVRTKMFDGIKGQSNFFLPRLSAEDLGGLISDVLWKGESQNIMTPDFAYISLFSKVLPEWMRVGMQDAGADIMTDLNPHHPLK
ncbi:short-chain dehydrogenase [Penicillium odoratum]|uniref:short-chain dehydrogenase n=1 Tax=Penicillium odoratum TaxID=1167516 RepID=UPI0025485AF7|nr:short-chain dehydrogenase [Penicillium odoratum]KAJ5765634.1 short-chain dehydrogenase [Penicillium odoratum]